MNILSFFRRRTKSRYANDKAVDDFTRVLTDQQRVDEAARIIANDNPTPEDIERLGDMLNGG